MALDALCVERVLDRWREFHPDDDRLERMLSLAQEVLDESVDRERAERELVHFENALGETQLPSDPQALATCAASAAAATLAHALYGDDDAALPPETTEEDLDYDAWEAPYWASLATSGGVTRDFDPEARRDFWRWYLDEAVPYVAR